MKNSNVLSQMGLLDIEILKCEKCILHETRINAVPGIGPINSPIMIIGEAPGANEDKEGIPFAGASGVVLDEMLEIAGLRRDLVFITNIVKCRPPENRDPKQEETEICSGYLTKQIELIKPSIIITLGRHSMYFILKDKTKTITEMHGKIEIMKDFYFIPMYHPAVTLYSRTKMRPKMETDFKRLKNFVDGIKSGEFSKYPNSTNR